MPQLDPGPWFLLLIFSWLTFITIIPPKIVAHSFPNDPTCQAAQKPKTDSWNWP